MKRLAVLVLVAGVALAAGSVEANWPQFRGEGARGIAEGKGLPDRWSATENVAWKTDLPGRGWSSPVVWGNRVFLTAAVNEGASEEPRKGLYFGGERPAPPKSAHQWKVIALDLKSGKQLWEQTVLRAQPKTGVHIKNSYASETPVTDGKRLYVYFGGLGVYCFDLQGKQLWNHPTTPHPTRFGWGSAASPILHQGRLYLVNDNEEKSYLLALDAATGKQIWRVEREEKSNWSTPYLWQHGAGTEIVTPGSGMVRSYSLDGKLLWWLKGMSDITIATPYAADGLLYVTSGYVGSRLRPIYAIRPGGRGDLSLPREQTSGPHIAWCDWTGAPYNPSTLVYDGRLYVLFDRGLLSAYHAGSGKMLLDRERIPDGRAFTTSPWAYNQRLFCLNEDGVTYVYSTGDTPRLLHINRLAEDDMCMATPAISGGRLLIRTAARLYCIGKP